MKIIAMIKASQRQQPLGGVAVLLWVSMKQEYYCFITKMDKDIMQNKEILVIISLSNKQWKYHSVNIATNFHNSSLTVRSMILQSESLNHLRLNDPYS